jgi:hypothetical protein
VRFCLRDQITKVVDGRARIVEIHDDPAKRVIERSRSHTVGGVQGAQHRCADSPSVVGMQAADLDPTPARSGPAAPARGPTDEFPHDAHGGFH